MPRQQIWFYPHQAVAIGEDFSLVISRDYTCAMKTRYTQQGLHITTLQMSNLSRKRVMCWIVYFVYLVPYFLCTHLATKSLGIKYDGTKKNLLLNVLKTTGICVGGLFVFYVIFALQLKFSYTVMEGFRTGILYAYGLAILPLTIGITVGNALNVYISSKTRSVWPGLFTAVLWACGRCAPRAV